MGGVGWTADCPGRVSSPRFFPPLLFRVTSVNSSLLSGWLGGGGCEAVVSRWVNWFSCLVRVMGGGIEVRSSASILAA